MFKWLEQYLIFTKTERKAVIGLMVLIILVIAVPRLYLYLRPAGHSDNSKYLKEAEQFSKNAAASEEENERTAQPEKTNTDENPKGIPVVTVDSSLHVIKKRISDDGYFNFDPNKIGVAEWIKLGFTEKQAIAIEHYKAKGAKFYKAEDLKKLFVMTDEHYEKLLPYVQIDGDALPKRKYRRAQ